MNERLTAHAVALTRDLIRNACVNDGTPDSGQEVRNAETLQKFLDLEDLTSTRIEPHQGRVSLVARLSGTDATAPTLCLMGHTDVVPANPDGWARDPFGGDLVDGEVWGRGALDMLAMTASMAVAFRELATSHAPPPGDVVYLAVADEEAGGTYGAGYLTSEHWDLVKCDYVLTEPAGSITSLPQGKATLVFTSEKGLAQRRIMIRGTPGHGSSPYASDNAVLTAAAAARRIADIEARVRPTKTLHRLVDAFGLPDEAAALLTSPETMDGAIGSLPPQEASFVHAITRTTFSPNVIQGGDKVNVIPDRCVIDVDVRLLPGDSPEDVDRWIAEALDGVADDFEIEVIGRDRAPSESSVDTPLWGLLRDITEAAHPGIEVIPSLLVGATDAAFFRERGAVAYGAGLMSEQMTDEAVSDRYHGNDERIDVESIGLMVEMWLEAARRLGSSPAA